MNMIKRNNKHAPEIKWVVVLLFLSLFASNVHADECKILNVSGSVGWTPLLMKNDENNAIHGLSYDLMKEISNKLSIPFQFEELPWKRALLYLEKGRIDMVLGIYWTKERAQKYYYTSPILENEARVFVLKENAFKFEQLSDLIGKQGDIPLGGSFGEEFDQYAKANLTLHGVWKKKEHIGRLQKSRSVFFISDYFDALTEIKKFGLEEKIIALPKAVSVTQVYFVLSKNSLCSYLAPEINNIIEWMKNDGSLKAITDKYLDPS